MGSFMEFALANKHHLKQRDKKLSIQFDVSVVISTLSIEACDLDSC